MARVTQQEAAAGVQLLKALAETIREAGEIPSGHLYAPLMGRMSLQTFSSAIGILKNAGLVAERGYVLSWVGPTFEKGEHEQDVPKVG